MLEFLEVMCLLMLSTHYEMQQKRSWVNREMDRQTDMKKTVQCYRT
jgi:hypothetical protein